MREQLLASKSSKCDRRPRVAESRNPPFGISESVIVDSGVGAASLRRAEIYIGHAGCNYGAKLPSELLLLSSWHDRSRRS